MKKKKWYKKSFRRNLVDMHIDSWNDEFLSKFNATSYFDCLKKAQIQSPMIYTHSHVGYCNWPTKTGEMHPGFKGVDKIKKLIDLCHADGMDVIAYYSLIYNNRIYKANPDWRMRDIHGKGSRDPRENDGNLHMMIGQGRYGLVCPNSKEYREFLKKQFLELCDNYEFEGIFLDMTFWPMICYCDNCKTRFKKETGKEIPEIVNWNDPNWLLFQKLREDWIGEFAKFTTSELKKIRPNLSIEHQFSTATHPWTFGVRSYVSDASDYTGGDLYGGFEQQSFICKLYYGITNKQPFEYMTSRCDPSLHDHTTTKSLEMLKLHAYLTYAHHGAFLAIDAIDPRGTLNKMFYDTLGKVFEETKSYEKYFTGLLKANTAVYFSLGSKMDTRSNKIEKAIVKASEDYPHIECSLGAGKALRRAHIPYTVVTDGKYKDINKYKTLILSDIAFMSTKEEEEIINFTKNGGSVYLSGITSPRLVSELLNIKITKMTNEEVTYVRPTPEGEKYFCNMYTAKYPMTIFGNQIISNNNNNNNTVLANITLPYTDPKDLTKFSSIHSNPPGVDTKYPSIVYGKYGKGKVIWSAAPFESSEQPVHKQVFINLLELLNNGKRLIETDAPHYVEFTLFDDKDKKCYFLHCINIQESFPMIKLNNFNVKINISNKVKSIEQLPDLKSINFSKSNGSVSFNIEKLDIFKMFKLQY